MDPWPSYIPKPYSPAGRWPQWTWRFSPSWPSAPCADNLASEPDEQEQVFGTWFCSEMSQIIPIMKIECVTNFKNKLYSRTSVRVIRTFESGDHVLLTCIQNQKIVFCSSFFFSPVISVLITLERYLFIKKYHN